MLSTLGCDLCVFNCSIAGQGLALGHCSKALCTYRAFFPSSFAWSQAFISTFSQEAPAEIFISRNCAMGAFSCLPSSVSLEQG